MGKLFHWKVKDLVQTIDRMIENKFDCVIAVDGKRSLGKSTVSYKIAKRVKNNFNPWRDIVYLRKDITKLYINHFKGVIWADEMINAGHNRDFYDQEQKKLIKSINMYRDNFNVFIWCIPNFLNLDTQLRNLVKIRL
ncbi:MAG: hypothetical protein WD512_10990, partial [Candidatus Paceibacterota bacterium]